MHGHVNLTHRKSASSRWNRVKTIGGKVDEDGKFVIVLFVGVHECVITYRCNAYASTGWGFPQQDEVWPIVQWIRHVDLKDPQALRLKRLVPTKVKVGLIQCGSR
jgi:hypothetical protein